jgi:hypothetical protein
VKFTLTIRLVAERDIIWAAGICDGESAIFLRRSISGKNPSHSVELEVSMTDKPTIEALYNIFGQVGSFRPAKRIKKAINHRQAWRWCVSSNQALMVIELILPYLRTKKEQAELVLTFRELKNTPGQRELNPMILAKREVMYHELKELKKVEYTI